MSTTAEPQPDPQSASLEAPPAPMPPPPAPAAFGRPSGVEQPPIASNGVRFAAYLVDSVLLFVTLGIGWLVWAAITAGEGQTPGKKLLKLQIWDTNTNTPMSWGKMVFLRGVLLHGIVAGFIYLFTLGITLLMPLWDKRNQTVVDKMSAAVCVQVR